MAFLNEVETQAVLWGSIALASTLSVFSASSLTVVVTWALGAFDIGA